MSNALLAQNGDSLEFRQYFYDDGSLSSEGYIEDGQPEGYWKSYFPNGTLKSEGDRVDHFLNGPWRFYNQEGELVNIIRYSFGKKQGLSETFQDSVLIAEEPYQNNRQEGLSKYYYPDGSIEKWVPFRRGSEDGQGYHFTPEGTVDAVLTYSSGVLTREQKINRTNRLGMKQGLWMEFDRNMNIRVEGTYRDDLKHGYWKFYQPNGNLIRIEHWINGVLQEDDDNTTKMEIVRTVHPTTGAIATLGGYQDGEKEGVHQQFDEDGNPIGAQLYRDDILLAEGRYDEEGRRQGEWKYYYPDGALKAIGYYVDDFKNEQWKYYFQDSTIEQVGYYIYDAPDGTWNWYFEDGELRKKQQFVDGLASGPVIEYNDSNEVIVEGQYIDGLKTGIWKYSNHNVVEYGEYVQDERQGIWRSEWIENEQLHELTEWDNGVQIGRYIKYFPNGNIRIRGTYNSGEKHGTWEYFAENGARIVTVEYDNGVELKYNGSRLRNP